MTEITTHDRPGAVRALIARRETLAYLVRSGLQSGNRDKLLGNVWNLLDPLFFIGVYFVVFGLGFKQAGGSPREFIVYLAVGVLIWRFFNGAVNEASACMRSRRALIHAIDFPKTVLPISIGLARLYDFGWGILVALIIAQVFGIGATIHIVWVLPLVLLNLLFVVGASLLVASVGAFFADTANISAVVLRLWFYASPIFYYARHPSGEPGLIPAEYMDLYMLNPMAGFMEGYRSALLWGRSPDFETLLYLCGVSVATFVLGFAICARLDGRFAKVI